MKAGDVMNLNLLQGSNELEPLFCLLKMANCRCFSSVSGEGMEIYAMHVCLVTMMTTITIMIMPYVLSRREAIIYHQMSTSKLVTFLSKNVINNKIIKPI